MDIEITGEDPLNYGKIQMNCDHRLDTDKLPFPNALASFVSGFFLMICGSSGSGKTNLLISLLKTKNKQKVRRSFKKIFDNVIVVSPSLKTLKDPIYDGLKHKFTTWDDETMDQVEALLDENDEIEDDDDDPTPERSLLILDDCGSQLKGGNLEKRFDHLVKNRRHRHLSIIVVSQKYKDCTTTVRSNLSHFIFFKPRNSYEASSIQEEMLNQPQKYMPDIMDKLFTRRYDHVMVDFTQFHGQGFMYYSNFRPITFKKIIYS